MLLDQIQIILSAILTSFCVYYSFPVESRLKLRRSLLMLSIGSAILLQYFFSLALLLFMLVAFISMLCTEKLSVQSRSVGFFCISLIFMVNYPFPIWLLLIAQIAVACWYFIPEFNLQPLKALKLQKLRPAIIVAGFQIAIFLNVQATTIICSCGGGGDIEDSFQEPCGCGTYNWTDDFFTLRHVKSAWDDFDSAR